MNDFLKSVFKVKVHNVLGWSLIAFSASTVLVGAFLLTSQSVQLSKFSSIPYKGRVLAAATPSISGIQGYNAGTSAYTPSTNVYQNTYLVIYSSGSSFAGSAKDCVTIDSSKYCSAPVIAYDSAGQINVSLSAISPAPSVSNHTVIVSNSNGSSLSSSFTVTTTKITYIQGQRGTTYTNNVVTQGSYLDIYGSFSDQNTKVTINGTGFTPLLPLTLTQIDVSISATPGTPGYLAAGSYTVTVTEGVASSISNSFTVIVPPPIPSISVFPSIMAFSGVSGSIAPSGQTFNISNPVSGAVLKWKTSTNQSWCYVNKAASTTGSTSYGSPTNITVTVGALSTIGKSNCTITVSDNGSSPAASNSPKTLTITYTVIAAPVVLVAPTFPLTVKVTGTNPGSTQLSFNYQPSSTSSLSPALLYVTPSAGSTFIAAAITTGQSINGQNLWWIVRSGSGGPSLYAWAGGTNISSFGSAAISSPDPMYYAAALKNLNSQNPTEQSFLAFAKQEGLGVKQYTNDDNGSYIELFDPYTNQLLASYNESADDLAPSPIAYNQPPSLNSNIVEAAFIASLSANPGIGPGICATTGGANVFITSHGNVNGIPGNYNLILKPLPAGASFTYNGTTYSGATLQNMLNTAVSQAVAAYNAVPGGPQGTISQSYSALNTITVNFDNSSFINNVMAEADTYDNWSGLVTQSNIVIYGQAFTKYLPLYQNGNNNMPLSSTQIQNFLNNTVLHEMGHSFGLDHSDQSRIMFSQQNHTNVTLAVTSDPTGMASYLQQLMSGIVAILPSTCKQYPAYKAAAAPSAPPGSSTSFPPGCTTAQLNEGWRPTNSDGSCQAPSQTSEPSSPSASCTAGQLAAGWVPNPDGGCMSVDSNITFCGSPGYPACPVDPDKCFDSNGNEIDCSSIPANQSPSTGSGSPGSGAIVNLPYCYSFDIDPASIAALEGYAPSSCMP